LEARQALIKPTSTKEIFMSGKPAARVSDPTACPLPGHGTNPITSGSPDVFFDGLSAARQTDPTACGSQIAGNVMTSVLINGLPAVVVGSLGSHGNVVTGGSGTVIIGNSGSGAAITPVTPLSLGFDEQFTLLDSDGEPVADFAYMVTTASGKVYRGVTNELGKTQRIPTSIVEELHLEPDDLA
jgi:uncharacterized Zn-binding protein involved in type VI secretion